MKTKLGPRKPAKRRSVTERAQIRAETFQFLLDAERPGAFDILLGTVAVAQGRSIPIGRGKRAREDWSIHCMVPGCAFAVTSGSYIANALYIAHHGECHGDQ